MTESGWFLSVHTNGDLSPMRLTREHWWKEIDDLFVARAFPIELCAFFKGLINAHLNNVIAPEVSNAILRQLKEYDNEFIFLNEVRHRIVFHKPLNPDRRMLITLERTFPECVAINFHDLLRT